MDQMNMFNVKYSALNEKTTEKDHKCLQKCLVETKAKLKAG